MLSKKVIRQPLEYLVGFKLNVQWLLQVEEIVSQILKKLRQFFRSNRHYQQLYKIHSSSLANVNIGEN